MEAQVGFFLKVFKGPISQPFKILSFMPDSSEAASENKLPVSQNASRSQENDIFSSLLTASRKKCLVS